MRKIICIIFISAGFVQCVSREVMKGKIPPFTQTYPPPPVIKPTQGVCIGNSTVARYLGGASVASLLFSAEEVTQGFSCHSLAVPGHTVYQQLAAWNAYPDKEKADWIIVEIGLNDLKPYDSVDSAIYRYQQLINTINRTKRSDAKVLLATMIPCKQRLADVYKQYAKISYRKWIRMNKAIMGKGKRAITGADFRFNGHTVALDDGKGNLKAEYEVYRKDHIHENTAGRQIVASYWRGALAVLGFL